jgi:hypothetical protein
MNNKKKKNQKNEKLLTKKSDCDYTVNDMFNEIGREISDRRLLPSREIKEDI